MEKQDRSIKNQRNCQHNNQYWSQISFFTFVLHVVIVPIEDWPVLLVLLLVLTVNIKSLKSAWEDKYHWNEEYMKIVLCSSSPIRPSNIFMTTSWQRYCAHFSKCVLLFCLTNLFLFSLFHRYDYLVGNVFLVLAQIWKLTTVPTSSAEAG